MKRLCRVCGGEYEYCYSCEKVHSWRALTDTADHYYVLNVLMDYQTDHDALKAYRALRKRGVDICETDGLLPGVQKILAEIVTLSNEDGVSQESVGKPFGVNDEDLIEDVVPGNQD